jgi:hypothetical protein
MCSAGQPTRASIASGAKTTRWIAASHVSPVTDSTIAAAATNPAFEYTCLVPGANIGSMASTWRAKAARCSTGVPSGTSTAAISSSSAYAGRPDLWASS